ncbi:MAG: cytochrome c biogenesis protein CcdA [Spirochaetaceae bacterium]|jgi:cytochrome c-type biogenesis protein|nr:cytochrome c biogenesis protein CcdA [Spirochaetaceae bacterium]
MDSNISIVTAFFAGILSFLSPCVLPLLSSYLMFISGSVKLDGVKFDGTRPGSRRGTGAHPDIGAQRVSVLLDTLAFVAGFTVVFVALSALLYSALFFLSGFSRILNIASGALVIVLGLNFIFGFIPLLKYDASGKPCETCAPDRGIFAPKKGASAVGKRMRGRGGAFLVGLAFGAGWTPCVGAFLGSVLLLASQTETLAIALACLAAYSAGLGLPFLVSGFFWSAILEKTSRFQRFAPALKLASGIFLVCTGLLIALGRFTLLNAWLQKSAYGLTLWTQSAGESVRLIPAALFLVLALLPLAVRALAKKKPFSPFATGWSALFLLLTAANGAGIINCAALLATWLSYTGV